MTKKLGSGRLRESPLGKVEDDSALEGEVATEQRPGSSNGLELGGI